MAEAVAGGAGGQYDAHTHQGIHPTLCLLEGVLVQDRGETTPWLRARKNPDDPARTDSFLFSGSAAREVRES